MYKQCTEEKVCKQNTSKISMRTFSVYEAAKCFAISLRADSVDCLPFKSNDFSASSNDMVHSNGLLHSDRT